MPFVITCSKVYWLFQTSEDESVDNVLLVFNFLLVEDIFVLCLGDLERGFWDHPGPLLLEG